MKANRNNTTENRFTRAPHVRIFRYTIPSKHTYFGEGGKGQDEEIWQMWML